MEDRKRPRLDVTSDDTKDDDDSKRCHCCHGNAFKTKIEDQDEEYFRSYADVSVHEEMLRDTVRTNAYRYAILKNYEKIRGKVVADVGAGTGVLSVFCVHAGAKHVYAIEASKMAEQTRKVVAENKMSDRITVVNSKVEDTTLPGGVDVIVSEWMGYSLLYESMLPSVLHARDRWLKKDGLMFPSNAVLYLAPFSDDDLQSRLQLWSEVKETYKVSMNSMKDYTKQCIANNVHVKCLQPENVLSHGVPVCNMNLYTVKAKDLHNVKKDFEFQCFGSSKLHGFVTWFTVSFPGDTQLSTSPYSEDTHWGQTLLYLEKETDINQDTCIRGSISISPHRNKPRFLDIHLTFRVDDEAEQYKYYFMNDCIS